ncbi:MAG: hypothetical protein R3B13_03880 [Polyangiaceae bacterium]
MRTKLLVFAGLLATLATACGGGSHGGAMARSAPSDSSPEPASAPGEATGGYDGEATSSAPASESMQPAAPSAGGQAFEERKAESDAAARPGLGTEWGENRTSRVSTAPFFREAQNPFAVAKLFYNDSNGARAMARQAGVSSLGNGMARIAGGSISVRLLDSSGQPLEGFDNGENTYVVGQHGQRYVIQLQNHTGARFEAVATVDGLDVINGRAGSFSNRGYILAPFATVEIDGFRRSFDTVASFRFGAVKNSYAAKKGSDRNVGVIGVAFFQERGTTFPWSREEINRRHGADPFPGQFSEPPATAF